jgi:hypothetical protein
MIAAVTRLVRSDVQRSCRLVWRGGRRLARNAAEDCAPMKREARTATIRRTAVRTAAGARTRRVRPIPAPTPLVREEIVILLRRLSGELAALLSDLGVDHEPSRNHESSRLARRTACLEK